ncbi:MAG: RidA family protein [Bryobacteraceae bacterium]
MKYFMLPAVLCAMAAHLNSAPPATPWDTLPGLSRTAGKPVPGGNQLLQRRKNKDEDFTQTREIPKDPPAAVVAETRRLVFRVSPLSAKGLLSQQVRDALKALRRSSGGSIVKLRAFVAGTGDMRRVQAIVSEVFTDRRHELPALSVIQVGDLPLEGAQVVLESTAVAKKEVSPHGLIFISGQVNSVDDPLAPVAPLVEKSLADLNVALKSANAGPKDVLRVTCLLSTLQDIQTVRGRVAAEYREAALNFVQIQRAPLRAVAECEAVARATTPLSEPLKLVNPAGLASSPNFSHVALVGAPRVALTGTQVAYGFQDGDARLAFERLDKALEAVGTSAKKVAMSSIYPLSNSLRDQASRIRFEFYDRARPPASTMLPFQGLPSMDAGFAVDVVAVVN